MTMILHIEFSYSVDDIVKKWTPEQRAELREKVLALKEIAEPTFHKYSEVKPGGAEGWWSFHMSGKHLVTEEEAAWLRSKGLDFNIKDFKNNYKPKDFGPGSSYHYHLPNIGLLMINEVTWLENACTEELQKHLNDDYRIIAVCPPNGARRPDYILGRTKEAA